MMVELGLEWIAVAIGYQELQLFVLSKSRVTDCPAKI